MRQPTVGISQTPIRIAPLIGVFLDIITKYCIIDTNLFGGYMKSHKSIMEDVLSIHNHELEMYGYIGITLILLFMVVEILLVLERVYINFQDNNIEE